MEASHSLFFFSLCFSSALLFTFAAAQPPPPPPPLNLIDTLQKAGQYSTLIRLLGTTRVEDELANELNNSFAKATFFAPTDGAFNSLPQGFLNSLTMEQQVKLLNFHVVPHLFTWNDFQNGVAPQQTQASGPNGPYVLTFAFISDQHVKVSTGLVETTFSNALNLTPPLAIYQVDQVLLPPDKFGAAASPASSPSPRSGAAPSSSASPSSSAPSSLPPHAPSSSSSPQPSAPSPRSAASPEQSAPASTSPPAPGSASAEAPGSTSSETGSAPAGPLGAWSLMGSLMAAVGIIALV